MEIRFHEPDIGRGEIEAVTQALRDGHIGGNGPICWRVQQQLRARTGAGHVLLMPSATLAQDLLLMALGIRRGDEVVMPAFASVSTANSILARGATPVFCDVDPATLNIDPLDVERHITRNTRAVLPVHYAGISADLDALAKICEPRGIKVIEDAAQGLGARHHDRHLGTIGDAGFLSFHATKNDGCGEGGALLIRSAELMELLELVHEKGTNRGAFLPGEVDNYTWVEIGGNFVLSDLLAAFLEVQLERSDELNRKRVDIWQRYHEGLAPLEEAGLIRRQTVPAYATHNGHLYGFRTRTAARRDAMLTGLKSAGVQASVHFQPLHVSSFACERLDFDGPLPVTEQAAARLVRLPLWAGLKDDEVDYVIETVSRVAQAYSGSDKGEDKVND